MINRFNLMKSINYNNKSNIFDVFKIGINNILNKI
jgi:hypothetical protein